MRLKTVLLTAGLLLGASLAPASAAWRGVPPGNQGYNAAQVHADRLLGRRSVRRHASRHGRHVRHYAHRRYHRAPPHLATCCDVPDGLEFVYINHKDAPAPVGYRRYVRSHRHAVVLRSRG